MYNSQQLAAPSTLIVNRYTEINYFDNPLQEKYAYDMVSGVLYSLSFFRKYEIRLALLARIRLTWLMLGQT